MKLFSRDITHTCVEYELYEINRTYEWQTTKGATNTLEATSEGVGTALDDIADKQDIIELALYDFFEKYGGNYTDLIERKMINNE